LGVAVLIVVMSVMNGFRTELVEKIIGFNPHAVIKPYKLSIDKEILQNIDLINLSSNFQFTNSGEAVLINKNYTKGLLLRGYLRNDFEKLKIVKNQNFIGNKKLNSQHISIGKDLSIHYDINIGDKILIMSPTGVETIVGSLPKQETYIVDSVFDSGISDFDQNIAFININDLENLFNLDENSRSLEIYFNDPKKIELKKKILQEIFQEEHVYTWSDLNKSLFSALKVERNVMFIILSLIIIVAAFNIISGLTILVKNKTREIAILKSIGVQNKSIIKIFFMVGFLIGSFATAFGITAGIIFSYYIENIRQFLSEVFNISLFPEEIYFLSKMPSEINFESIFLIGLSSIIITSIVSIFPAIKASKMDPVKSLKYE
jgi:lipoprotein-releasing system permease protein